MADTLPKPKSRGRQLPPLNSEGDEESKNEFKSRKKTKKSKTETALADENPEIDTSTNVPKRKRHKVGSLTALCLIRWILIK